MAPRIPGIPCKLFTPQVSCVLVYLVKNGCKQEKTHHVNSFCSRFLMLKGYHHRFSDLDAGYELSFLVEFTAFGFSNRLKFKKKCGKNCCLKKIWDFFFNFYQRVELKSLSRPYYHVLSVIPPAPVVPEICCPSILSPFMEYSCPSS